MDRTKNIEKELPADYVLVKRVDAKSDKKIMLIYSLLSIVPLIVLLPIFALIAKACDGKGVFSEPLFVLPWIFLSLVVFIIYIILHELTHGITYKIYTGEKLAFGLTLTVAFCGVPNVYVRRKASLAALVMPFAVFSVIFLAIMVWFYTICGFFGFIAGFVFALHFGGCVGDLHWTILLLTKYRKCNTLMRDTGPEQYLYVPKAEAELYGFPVLTEENK